MTDADFDAAIRRSGLPLTPETIAELRKAAPTAAAQIARATADQPRENEPALIFRPEQLA